MNFPRNLILGVLFIASVAVAGIFVTTVLAQGRYQISAYGGMTDNGVSHGCYVVNTATGQVWHTRAGGSPEKVGGKLP